MLFYPLNRLVNCRVVYFDVVDANSPQRLDVQNLKKILASVTSPPDQTCSLDPDGLLLPYPVLHISPTAFPMLTVPALLSTLSTDSSYKMAILYSTIFRLFPERFRKIHHWNALANVTYVTQFD